MAELDVIRQIDGLKDVPQQRLQAVANDWLKTPKARECAVTKVMISDDLKLNAVITFSSKIDQGQQYHFPFDDLMIYLVEHAPQLIS